MTSCFERLSRLGAPRSCSAMHDTGKDHTCDDFVTPGHDSLPKTCEDHYDNCASPLRIAARRLRLSPRSGPCCAASLLPAQQALTSLLRGVFFGANDPPRSSLARADKFGLGSLDDLK